MYKSLYKWSSPQWFYVKSQIIARYFGALAALFLMVGLLFALVFSPPDYQQGDTVRIMYVHVPCALFSMLCFAAMWAFSLLLLVWRVKLAGILIRSLAVIGFCMSLIALISGSLWGKPMWGTWWIWDARLTSEFVLALLYLAILSIPSSFRQQEIAEKGMAIVSIIGLIDLPIIHYSVYWWQTLHQKSSFSFGEKPLIAPSMLIPLALMALGFAFFIGWFVLKSAQAELLRREYRANWILQVLNRG